MEEVGASSQLLGEHYRTHLGLVFPPEENILTLQLLVNKCFQVSSVTAQFLQLIGFLISLMDVIPLGRLHIRPIQWYLREFWHPVTQMWEACIPVLPRLLPHLQWWLQRSNLLIGVSLSPPESTLTLYTDASITGWGAFLEGRTVSGVWEDCHLEERILLLEMRAVLLSSRSDSKTVSVDSHRQYDSGGFIFRIKGELTPFLCIFYAEKVCCYASLQTVLTVRHVPGNQNLIADALSRFGVPVNTEWKLHPVIFQAIALIWDRPLIDLFATSLNYKLETFVYPIPDQKAWAVDAMTISWKEMFNYIFPPFCLLHRILHKMREDGCKTILIAPAWPRQSWFPDLLLLSCAKPLRLPLRGDLLSQFKGKKLHQGLEKLHLHAWLLSGRLSDREAFLKKQPSASLEQL